MMGRYSALTPHTLASLLLAFCLTATAQAQRLYAPSVYLQAPGLSREATRDLPRMEQSIRQVMSAYAPPLHCQGLLNPIECDLTMDFSQISGARYVADIAFKVYRPIYGSTHRTLLLQHVIPNVHFDYDPYRTISYSGGSIPSDPFVRRLFYLQTIGAALYYDSFGREGGAPFYALLKEYAGDFQPLSDDDTRLTIALNPSTFIPYLSSSSAEAFRDVWYVYHREGLDGLQQNPKSFVTALVPILTVLQRIQTASPTDPFLRLFSESKMGELHRYIDQADPSLREGLTQAVQKLFPNF